MRTRGSRVWALYSRVAVYPRWRIEDYVRDVGRGIDCLPKRPRLLEGVDDVCSRRAEPLDPLENSLPWLCPLSFGRVVVFPERWLTACGFPSLSTVWVSVPPCGVWSR